MLQIIYLDEVHRLTRRGMDERFLKPMETFQAIWIASSACVKKDRPGDDRKLDKMFQNRFSFRISTEKPSMSEMMKWLVQRCIEFGVQAETPEATLRRLAERADRIPGMALQVLNKAHKKRHRVLTLKMVEEHTFDFDD